MGRRVPGPPPGVERVFEPKVLQRGTKVACDVCTRAPSEHGDGVCPKTEAEARGDIKVPSEVLVTLRDPTEGRKRSYFRSTLGDVHLQEDGTRQSEIDVDKQDTARQALLEECVVRVGGYTGRDGKPIATVGELLEHGESEIINAVAAELLYAMTLPEEQKKTSGGSSDSTPSPATSSTKTATGTASAVAPPAGMSSEGAAPAA